MMRAGAERIRRRAAGRALLAMSLLLPGGAACARAAALKSVSPAQFRADVARLQGLVAACGESVSSAAACDPAQVGDDERVGGSDSRSLDNQSFVMHWEWLRDALQQARTAKIGRPALLRDAAAQLQEIAQESVAVAALSPQSVGRARAAANAILAQAQFQGADGPTWWDREKAKLLGWLARIFEGVDRLGSAAPWLGKLLEWLLFVGAAVGLLFFLLRNAARQRLRVSMGAGAAKATAWDRESTDWARMAEVHAAESEWRDAVHCLYWAAIVLLEGRRAWRHNPARTPREYVRLLRAGSAQQRALGSLTRVFEHIWYGLREADAQDYARARELYERIAAGAEGDAVAAIGPAAQEAV